MTAQYTKDPKRDVLHYKYDFDVNGGAVSTISLGTIPTKFVITEVYIDIETTLTSGGTPTVVLGNAADADGYVAEFWATRTAATALKGGGALVSGGVYHTALANVDLKFAIGTAALTAGKFHVKVVGHMAY